MIFPQLDFSFLCSEWLTNQHRDTYASYVGHHALTSHIALAENESIARVRFNMLEVCGTVLQLVIRFSLEDSNPFSFSLSLRK